MPTASQFKWLLFLLLAVLLVIIVFQNLAEIEVRLLFWKGTLPQAAVLGVTALVGFLMGLFANTLWKVRAWRIKHRGGKDKSHDEAAVKAE
jgi:uncharacterized integral membrane protein